MPRSGRYESPFRYFNSSPEIIRPIVVEPFWTDVRCSYSAATYQLDEGFSKLAVAPH